MLRRLLLASAGAVALAGSALAADLPSQAPPPVYIPPAPIFTWTGIYVGGQVGYAWGTQNFIDTGADVNGVIGGAHIGYNLQFNQFLIGLEGSVDGSSLKQNIFILAPTAVGVVPVTIDARANIQGSVRGRVGYTWDRVLIYGTGGLALAGVQANVATPFGFESFRRTAVGWTVGGGLEYAITNNWSVRAEYRYSQFEHATNAFGGVGGSFGNRRFTENQVQAGFSYKFDTAVPAPVVAKY